MLNWFDSLIDQKKANMIDFKFIIQSRLLDTPTPVAISVSPLVEEIRTRYGEYAHPRIKGRFMTLYVGAIKEIEGINIKLDEYYTELNKIIRKTNPYADYTKPDSLLFYSSEFIWLYKEIVRLHQREYFYKVWLAHERLQSIMEEVIKELNRYDVEISKECYQLDFTQRYKCWEGSPIDSKKDTVESIRRIVDRKIIEHNTKLKNEAK